MTGETAAAAPALEALRRLHGQIRACTACGLHATRTQAVPGAGPSTAPIMIVGEAPGVNEDLQGRPFVGAAGKLLDTLLAGIGLDRGAVFITNVLKCRPPQNRDPMPSEAETCDPYLREQMRLIEPRVVLVLGRHALERLLPGHGPISRVHGQMVERDGVVYMPVYHPAAALHNPLLVGELQRDFDAVRRHLERVLPPPPAAIDAPEPAHAAEPVQLPLI